MIVSNHVAVEVCYHESHVQVNQETCKMHEHLVKSTNGNIS